LDIHLIAEANAVDIPPNHGVKPDTTIITHDHIANDRGVWSDKTVGALLRPNTFYGEYYGHIRGLKT
jgi:hypothetical protein